MIHGKGGSYSADRLDSIDDVYAFFPDEGTDFTLNWLFIGTSGVHGSYLSLDDAEAFFKQEGPLYEEFVEDGITEFHLTVLVVQPRRVRMIYGEVPITADDVPKLRYLVTKTLAGVQKSQAGSILKWGEAQ